MRMAGMAAAGGGNGGQSLPITRVAHVVYQCPGPVERGGSKVVGVPAHRIARGIAHRAIDAFDGGVRGLPRGCRRHDALDRMLARLARCGPGPGFLPLLEERRQVARQVFDDGEIGERADLEPAICDHLCGVCPTGPTRATVHRHGAAAAHAHATGKPVGQGGIDVALHPSYDVEDGLIVTLRHAIGLIAAVRLAAPQRYCDVTHCCYLTQTRTRCTALLPNPPESQRGSSGWVSPLASVARQANSYSPAWACHRYRQACQANLPCGGSRRAGCQRPLMATSTCAIGTPPPDQARPKTSVLPASSRRWREYQSGIPGGTRRALTRMCVTGVPGRPGAGR